MLLWTGEARNVTLQTKYTKHPRFIDEGFVQICTNDSAAKDGMHTTQRSIKMLLKTALK